MSAKRYPANLIYRRFSALWILWTQGRQPGILNH